MAARASGQLDGWPLDRLEEMPDGPWLVVHARPRQEKQLAASLRAHGAPCLLFLQTSVKVYPGKGTQVHLVPLLPGYVFVPGDNAAMRQRLYDIGRFVRLLPVMHTGDLRSDLIDLARLITRSEEPLLVRPELVHGTRVQLVRGSLAGLSGVVQRRQGRCALVVNVRMLGTSVSVTCTATDVDLPPDEAEPPPRP